MLAPKAKSFKPAAEFRKDRIFTSLTLCRRIPFRIIAESSNNLTQAHQHPAQSPGAANTIPGKISKSTDFRKLFCWLMASQFPRIRVLSIIQIRFVGRLHSSNRFRVLSDPRLIALGVAG
jgi:hypothetical protein